MIFVFGSGVSTDRLHDPTVQSAITAQQFFLSTEIFGLSIGTGVYYDVPLKSYELKRAVPYSLTLRRIGGTLGALRLCCTNSMANRYKLRYQCISTLTGGTGTSGIGTF